ncbi:MAG: alpha/beta fold hydrolase [Anaerolineaceae bacterium]|nr:alpha/beta fold hydrolase [Anaerolineaceae bacterium]
MPESQGIYYRFHHLNRSAPPLVLLHAAGGSHLSWPPAFYEIPDHPVIAVDLPGHGRSGRLSAPLTIDLLSQSIFILLDHLKIHRAIFVGHSMGGVVALNCALTRPERVLSIALLSSASTFTRLRNFVNSGDLGSPNRLRGELMRSGIARSTPEDLKAIMARSLESTAVSSLIEDWQACLDWEESTGSFDLKQPVFIAAGAEDQIIPPSDAALLAKRLSNSEFFLYPDASHMLPLEQTEQLLNDLICFLVQYRSS